MPAVVAQTQQGEQGGSSPFMLIMLVVLAVFMFMMFRRSRKTMKAQQEQRASLETGMSVMTSFGLYGTIIDIDKDDNKAILQLSPGNFATVHLQAVGQVVEETDEDENLSSEHEEHDDSLDTPEYGSEYDNDPRDDRDR